MTAGDTLMAAEQFGGRRHHQKLRTVHTMLTRAKVRNNCCNSAWCHVLLQHHLMSGAARARSVWHSDALQSVVTCVMPAGITFMAEQFGGRRDHHKLRTVHTMLTRAKWVTGVLLMHGFVSLWRGVLGCVVIDLYKAFCI
jgi:hypothetical protein